MKASELRWKLLQWAVIVGFFITVLGIERIGGNRSFWADLRPPKPGSPRSPLTARFDERRNARDGCWVVIRGYFDESYKDHRVYAIGGYIGRDRD
jgi:hypothetical protein